MGSTARSICSAMVGFAGVFTAGCIPALPLRDLPLEASSPPPIMRVRLKFAPAEDQALMSALPELIEIALKHHPDLSFARARIEAARGQYVQAGLYPNPIIGPRISQLGDTVNNWGEAGWTFTQTIVTKNKLGIARQAAARGIEAADWQAITKWNDVVTRVRTAYFELLTAKRELETLDHIVHTSMDALKTAESLEKAGAGNRPDVLRARVELEQNRLKLDVSRRRVEAAEQMLYTALGRPPVPWDFMPNDGKELEKPSPDFEWKSMLDCLRERSSELQEPRSLIAQQERLVAKAIADVTPDVTVNIIPFYAAYAKEMRGLVAITAPIPIFDRNQGNIHAAKSNLARLMAEEQQIELRLIDRLTGSYQRYQAARQQTITYRDVIVPGARESLKLVEAGYKGGDRKYDYTALLQAQQVLFQAQLSQTQAIGELWRSIVEIAGILQQPELNGECVTRR
jgi:cobalt-zinc-cadmium efflux system outer membrane protein